MSGNINNNTATASRSPHLSVVQGSAAGDTARIGAPRTIGGGAATAYGAPVSTGSPRHESSIRAVARTFDRFEEAVLPMVLAAGVTGQAAVAVADAIMATPALRRQAENAFRAARVTPVES